MAAQTRGDLLPEFPEAQLVPHLDNTWGDTGRAIVNNWLGLVYKLTHLDRKKLFMDHIDPKDPLRLRNRLSSNGSTQSVVNL
jgi:homoserine O-succinyltransferase